MSIRGIKALTARLHSDEATRSRFASDADAVLSEYRLTAGEKRAIKAAHVSIGPDGGSTRDQSTPLDWWYS